MKCYVCGKQYEGSECARCGFPAVEVPNASWEQGRDALSATIVPYRTNFLNEIEISLVAYRYRDENGVYVLDREEPVSLGTGTTLYGKENWLDQEFARLEDPSFCARLRLKIRGKTREEQVELSNLKAAELQKIGIALDNDFNIRLMLGNASEKPTSSAPIEL